MLAMDSAVIWKYEGLISVESYSKKKSGWKSNEDIICPKTWTKNLFISNTAFLQEKKWG